MRNFWILVMIIGTVFLLISCSEKKEEVSSPVSQIKSIQTSDGVNIIYEINGTGQQTLVFVHCWCCDRSYWKNQIEEFSKEFTVVTLDLAGHGQSGMEREDWTLSLFAEDVAAVINNESYDSIILVGHSMGGSVIIETARKLPGKIKALIGVDCYNSLGASLTAEQINEFLKPFRTDFEGTTRAFVSTKFGEKADSSVATWIIDDMSSAPPEVGVGAFENLFAYLFRGGIIESIKEINLPIYSINSAGNPTNIEIGKELAPVYEVTEIDSVGHFIQLEAPGEFNKVLKGILGGIK